MNQRILYPNTETGGVQCIFPAADCGLSIETIALKDVPVGLPYVIVEADDLPSFTFFEAWEMDFANSHGFGADYGVGSTNAVIGWLPNGTPILENRA
jgi:hypothetical protein